MKNERMCIDELRKRFVSSPFPIISLVSENLWSDAILYYEGKPVIFSNYVSGEVILYSGCEWCQRNGYDKNYCCKFCGGPIE